MNTDSLQQFADENSLEFERSVNKRLSGALTLSFYDKESCHAYTYYVGLWELKNTNHDAIINDVINKVKINLLDKKEK